MGCGSSTTVTSVHNSTADAQYLRARTSFSKIPQPSPQTLLSQGPNTPAVTPTQFEAFIDENSRTFSLPHLTSATPQGILWAYDNQHSPEQQVLLSTGTLDSSKRSSSCQEPDQAGSPICIRNQETSRSSVHYEGARKQEGSDVSRVRLDAASTPQPQAPSATLSSPAQQQVPRQEENPLARPPERIVQPFSAPQRSKADKEGSNSTSTAAIERWRNSLVLSLRDEHPFGLEYRDEEDVVPEVTHVRQEFYSDVHDGMDSDQSFTAGWSATEPADPLWWQHAVFENSLNRVVDVSAQLEAARRELAAGSS